MSGLKNCPQWSELAICLAPVKEQITVTGNEVIVQEKVLTSLWVPVIQINTFAHRFKCFVFNFHQMKLEYINRLIYKPCCSILYQIKHSFIFYLVCYCNLLIGKLKVSFIIIKNQKQNLYILILVPNNCL